MALFKMLAFTVQFSSNGRNHASWTLIRESTTAGRSSHQP